MDIIAILLNTAEAIDKVINVTEATKQLRYWRDEQKRKDFLASWRAGHLQLAQQRLAITQLLCEYYASSDNGTAQGLWYSFQHADPLPLPLVTINNLLLNTRSSLQLTAEFISGKCPTPALKEEDLIKQVDQWAAVGHSIWDAQLYSAREVSHDGRVKLQRASFLAYRATFGALVDELALGVQEGGVKGVRDDPVGRLPLRSQLLPSLDQLVHISGRISAGGPAVLFAVRLADGDVAIVVQKRSYKVADELGAFTVIPKAFHQPMVDPASEAPFEKTVWRECYEELFGGGEEVERVRHLDPEFYLHSCPAVRELQKPGVAELQATGMVWDLVRGNYHPTYCLFVRDPAWWERYRHEIRLNWEVDAEVMPLVRLRDHASVSFLLGYRNWAPEAYVSFVEGLRWLTSQPDAAGIAALASLLPKLQISCLGDLPHDDKGKT